MCIRDRGNLRLNSNLGDKGIMGAVNILQLHFWISDRLQAGLLEGLLVGFAVAGIDGILDVYKRQSQWGSPRSCS